MTWPSALVAITFMVCATVVIIVVVVTVAVKKGENDH